MNLSICKGRWTTARLSRPGTPPWEHRPLVPPALPARGRCQNPPWVGTAPAPVQCTPGGFKCSELCTVLAWGWEELGGFFQLFDHLPRILPLKTHQWRNYIGNSFLNKYILIEMSTWLVTKKNQPQCNTPKQDPLPITHRQNLLSLCKPFWWISRQ